MSKIPDYIIEETKQDFINSYCETYECLGAVKTFEFDVSYSESGSTEVTFKVFEAGQKIHEASCFLLHIDESEEDEDE